MEEYLKAIDEWETKKKECPNNATPYFMLGTIYQDIEEYEKALENYEIFSKLKPDNKEVYSLIMQVKQSMGILSPQELLDLVKKSGSIN